MPDERWEIASSYNDPSSEELVHIWMMFDTDDEVWLISPNPDGHFIYEDEDDEEGEFISGDIWGEFETKEQAVVYARHQAQIEHKRIDSSKNHYTDFSDRDRTPHR